MTFHRYVRFEYVEDYLRLGWMALPTLVGTHHGRYSVHMAWICGCGVKDLVHESSPRVMVCHGQLTAAEGA